MRIETVLLALGVASIVVGGTFAGNQAQNAPSSKPLKAFAQAKEDDFTGSTACAECHDTKSAEFPKSAHSPYTQREDLDRAHRGCESCHGPGKPHKDKAGEEDDPVLSYKKMSAQEVSDACLRCHGTTMKMGQWHRTEHGRAKNVSCTSCHQIHPDSDNEFVGKANNLAPKNELYPARKSPPALLKAEEAVLCSSCHRMEGADFRKQSHHPLPEGRLNCSDCHDIHPTKKTPMTRREALKAKCVVCHTEFAGPFIYEHDPVSGNTGEGCQECHKPHGSNNPNLLNSFSRGVCAKCHTDKATLHYPGRTCWQAGCHVSLHGSNSDSRFLAP